MNKFQEKDKKVFFGPIWTILPQIWAGSNFQKEKKLILVSVELNPLFYAAWGINDGIGQCRRNCRRSFVWLRQIIAVVSLFFWNMKFS